MAVRPLRLKTGWHPATLSLLPNSQLSRHRTTRCGVFQQNASRTLRTELNTDAVLIIDYVDAFGGKLVRAISGIESAVLDAGLWLPDWISPVDANSPVKIVDADQSKFNSLSAVGAQELYRSAIALAIPGKTGAAGMLLALSIRPIEFDDAQIDAAKTIARLLSLST